MTAPSVPRLPNQWPTDVTSFVGRRRELRELRRALSSSRLVNLTGVGGVGKTRLALRVAWDLRRAFQDGVRLVELAGLEDEGLVPQAVVTALGIYDQSTRWTPETVADRLGDQQLLLVIDNCEHVLQSCAVMVATLLRDCPNLRVLATSRQALGIAGERVWPLAALAVPEADAEIPAQRLTEFEAVSLFVDRATAVVPEFDLDERTGPVVARICRRLDGIPLAIELAAVSLRILAPDDILRRLDDRFGFLTSGNRASFPRHQTLRALIDWSFDLCSDEERALWARSSVFAEDFDLEGAEIVCAGGELTTAHVLDAVTGLVDKSILIRTEHGGRVRYRLLETIRQYGLDALNRSAQVALVRGRHRDRYSDLVEQFAHGWFGPDQVSWFSRMKTEHANTRTALEHCLAESGDISVAMRIVDSLLDYWRTGGLISEGRRWCDRILERDSAASAPRLRLVITASHLALLQGDLSAADALLEEGRRLSRVLGDETGRLLLKGPEGLAAALRRDFPRAIATYESALDQLREKEELRSLLAVLFGVGMCYSLLGDSTSAAAYYEELLGRSQSQGEKWRRSYALWGLGVEAWRAGELQHAAELIHESLELQRKFNDHHTVGQCVEVLAWIAMSQGENEQAARLFGVSNTFLREGGTPLLAFFDEYHHHCERAVRRALGEQKYGKFFAQGASVRLQNAVGYALGEPVGASTPVAPERETELSRRELEIADLVVQGMSNKQIANTLVLSQRTAEAHVQNILLKLGFTSRAQIAAWATERQSRSH
ncbi:ATP-binding protein [Saccharopolyspora phatthalungensis]|uniref:Non-specific serine/threonine protein kinase n=1 Tax=Saccharopolyspora phatthalungensis TaxID=664693 RepID=A0A840QHU1_9PSEU|nr:LuxR C-terminal-related transcriptional regulator [Saccharopolyspora phatthalungensis]MBB5159600.1 non-specific serine/threonine protein kinase [Saccharopolyspora phatthalungensis]